MARASSRLAKIGLVSNRHPVLRQRHADHQDNSADRREDDYLGDKANDWKNYADDNQGRLVTRLDCRLVYGGNRATRIPTASACT